MSTPSAKKAWPADAIEQWAIDRVIPNARNPRTHSDAQVAQIAASMREWGWTSPLLVDEQGTLIAGHGRMLAARQLEVTTVPVMIARGWTETQKRAYVIADNKLALNAGWDDELLALEMNELAGLDFNVDLTGFSLDELTELSWVPTQKEAPDEFQERDEGIETEHACPKCGYQWSGSSK